MFRVRCAYPRVPVVRASSVAAAFPGTVFRIGETNTGIKRRVNGVFLPIIGSARTVMFSIKTWQYHPPFRPIGHHLTGTQGTKKCTYNMILKLVYNTSYVIMVPLSRKLYYRLRAREYSLEPRTVPRPLYARYWLVQSTVVITSEPGSLNRPARSVIINCTMSWFSAWSHVFEWPFRGLGPKRVGENWRVGRTGHC